MTVKVEYVQLGGGLDVASSALAVRPGRMASGVNFEQAFGKQGYRRIDGYERYDGQPSPSAAAYFKLNYDGGTADFLVGDIITSGLATARVVAVSGTTASGVLALDAISGTFADNAAITVGGSARADVDGVVESASSSDAEHVAWTQAAVYQRRELIQKVPGFGPVRGIGFYKGSLYAVRDIASGLSSTLWRATDSGWVSIKTGMYPGGSHKMIVANFSGDANSLALFGVSGKGRLYKWDGTTFSYADPIFGSVATSATSVTIGTGTQTFTLDNTARSYVAGDAVTIWSASDAAQRMTGLVTSYTSGTNVLVVDVTSTFGSGTFTDWEMGKSDWSDRPYDLVAYKDHLFLAFPRGQLQTSNLGDPMTYTTSAALFGLGDEITGFAGLAGGVLAVFCSNKIDFISGSSLLDWTKENHSVNSGAAAGTIQPNSGNAIYLDDRGVTTLQSTKNYGSFEPSVCSRDVDSILKALPAPVGSVLLKGKYQYRLYYADGSRLTGAIMNPIATIQPNDISFTNQQTDHSPTCFCSGEVSDAPVYFFGTADGYVMQDDVGTSFDGGAIASSVRLHFNSIKSPSVKKRFRRLALEMNSPAPIVINFRQLFDYSNGTFSPGVTMSADALGGGGAWNSAAWGTFYWSTPVATEAEVRADGYGRNMALLFWHESAIDAAFTIQGVLIHYSPYGLQR